LPIGRAVGRLADSGQELGLAYRHLRTPGVVVSNDVNLNAAFHEFVDDTKPSAAVVMNRGDADGGCAGVGVFT